MNIVNIIGDIAIMLSAHIKVHRPRLIDKEKLVSVIYLSLFSLFVSVSLSVTRLIYTYQTFSIFLVKKLNL